MNFEMQGRLRSRARHYVDVLPYGCFSATPGSSFAFRWRFSRRRA